MNNPFLLPPPIRLHQAHEDGASGGGSATDPITRRKFLKRTGGATVASVVAWSLVTNSADATETEGEGSSFVLVCVIDPFSPGYKNYSTTQNGSRSLTATVDYNTTGNKCPLEWVATRTSFDLEAKATATYTCPQGFIEQNGNLGSTARNSATETTNHEKVLIGRDGETVTFLPVNPKNKEEGYSPDGRRLIAEIAMKGENGTVNISASGVSSSKNYGQLTVGVDFEGLGISAQWQTNLESTGLVASTDDDWSFQVMTVQAYKAECQSRGISPQILP